jgi:hypothetical protein
MATALQIPDLIADSSSAWDTTYRRRAVRQPPALKSLPRDVEEDTRCAEKDEKRMGAFIRCDDAKYRDRQTNEHQ